jgi:flavin-dependent dehydrogenase
LDKLCGDQWLAIGDAASAYDPITAQGIAKSLMNGISAAKAIQNQMNGNPRAIEEFEQALRIQYRQYLEMRHHFYCLEQRWPQSEFWRTAQRAIGMPHAAPASERITDSLPN